MNNFSEVINPFLATDIYGGTFSQITTSTYPLFGGDDLTVNIEVCPVFI